MAASSPPTPDNHPAAPPHPGAGCVRLVVEEEGDQRHAQAKVQQHDDQQHQQRPAERKEGRSVDALLVRSTGRRVEGGGGGRSLLVPSKGRWRGPSAAVHRELRVYRRRCIHMYTGVLGPGEDGPGVTAVSRTGVRLVTSGVAGHNLPRYCIST